MGASITPNPRSLQKSPIGISVSSGLLPRHGFFSLPTRERPGPEVTQEHLHGPILAPFAGKQEGTKSEAGLCILISALQAGTLCDPCSRPGFSCSPENAWSTMTIASTTKTKMVLASMHAKD